MKDGLLWYKDGGRHSCDDLSMALVQANSLLEDGSQIEAGDFLAEGAAQGSAAGPCVGVYDGHGGPDTARFLADSLVQHLKEFELLRAKAASAKEAYENFVSKHGLIQPWAVSDDVVIIRKTDDTSAQEAYRNLVRKQWLDAPRIASIDLCFLVDVIKEGVTYMAFDSDSRVRTTPKISRRDLLAERRQDVAHKTMSTRLNRKTEKRDTRLNRKTEKR